MKKNLSIALVSSYTFTKEPGGVKDFILGLKDALKKSGCKVFVIAPGSKEAQRKGLVDFVLGMDFRVFTDQTEFSASLSRQKTAKKIIETINPDIIILNEPFVPSIGHTIISTVKKMEGRRPVMVGQFHASRKNLNWGLRVAEFVARHFIRRPNLNKRTVLGLSLGYVSTINNNLDGRIAVSQTTSKFWQNKLPADYKVIYNGIDIKSLTVNGPKIKSWKKDGKRVILFAGRHDHRKGIDDLIDAFNLLVEDGYDNIKLKITGNGEATKALQKQVKKLGLQNLVEFVGVLSQKKLAQAYRTADLLVAPSTGGEGFNRTIIEAQACGCLVVCTDIDGQNEAIGDYLSPFMAKPKNPQSLARKMTIALNLSDARKRNILKQSGNYVKSHYSWDAIVKNHLAYYRELAFK